MTKSDYPTNVYFRIVRATTDELRVDLYKALDESDYKLHHVMPCGSFFLRDIGVKTKDEEILEQPISALVKKIKERITNK